MCIHVCVRYDEIIDFSRWFVIQETDDSVPLTSLSAFAVGKQMKAQIRTLVSVRRLQRGDILVQTDNATYANMLLKVESLAHVPVKVTPHQTMTESTQVIFPRQITLLLWAQHWEKMRSVRRAADPVSVFHEHICEGPG